MVRPEPAINIGVWGLGFGALRGFWFSGLFTVRRSQGAWTSDIKAIYIDRYLESRLDGNCKYNAMISGYINGKGIRDRLQGPVPSVKRI